LTAYFWIAGFPKRRALLDCGFPEEPRPTYKRGRGSALFELHFPRSAKTLVARRLAARLPAMLLFAGDLARVKQTARRRRRYVVKGKCALGPFLSILVIECQRRCLNVNLYPWMDKVQIKSKGMFLSLSTLF
jgi:hypothetical protein